MKCPVSQWTARWAAFIAVTFSSMVSAPPSRCPVSSAGLPQFVDLIEGRCSPCTSGVCKTYPSIPEPCVCTCVAGYRARDYTEVQKRLCQRDQPGDATTPNNYQPVILSCVSLAIVIPVALVVTVVSYKKWKGRKNVIQEQASLMTKVDDTIDDDINKATDGNELTASLLCLHVTAPAALPSDASSSIVQVHESQPSSHRVTSPPRHDRTPEQESQNDGHVGTGYKTTRRENLSGIPEVGPCTPEKLAPSLDRDQKFEG